MRGESYIVPPKKIKNGDYGVPWPNLVHQTFVLTAESSKCGSLDCWIMLLGDVELTFTKLDLTIMISLS